MGLIHPVELKQRFSLGSVLMVIQKSHTEKLPMIPNGQMPESSGEEMMPKELERIKLPRWS